MPVPRLPLPPKPKAHVEPTERQLDVLGVIVAFCEKHGYSPTRREIGRILGVRSVNAITYHLGVLEQAGCIRKPIGIARGISVTPAGLKRLNERVIDFTVPDAEQLLDGEVDLSAVNLPKLSGDLQEIVEKGEALMQRMHAR